MDGSCSRPLQGIGRSPVGPLAPRPRGTQTTSIWGPEKSQRKMESDDLNLLGWSLKYFAVAEESSVSKREGKRNVHEHLQETEKHGEVQAAFLYKEFGTRPGLRPFLVLMFEQRSSFLFSAADLSWHRSSASDEATLDSMMNEAPSGTCLSS